MDTANNTTHITRRGVRFVDSGTDKPTEPVARKSDSEDRFDAHVEMGAVAMTEWL